MVSKQPNILKRFQSSSINSVGVVISKLGLLQWVSRPSCTTKNKKKKPSRGGVVVG